MDTGSWHALEPLLPAIYLGVGAVVFDQAGQLVAGMPRFDPTTAAWRFQVASIAVSRVAGIAAGLILLLAAGQWLERGRAVQVARLGLLSLGGLLAAALVSLWFDGAILKGAAGAAALDPFVRNWLRVLTVTTLALMIFLGFMVGERRSKPW